MAERPDPQPQGDNETPATRRTFGANLPDWEPLPPGTPRPADNPGSDAPTQS